MCYQGFAVLDGCQAFVGLWISGFLDYFCRCHGSNLCCIDYCCSKTVLVFITLGINKQTIGSPHPPDFFVQPGLAARQTKQFHQEQSPIFYRRNVTLLSSNTKKRKKNMIRNTDGQTDQTRSDFSPYLSCMGSLLPLSHGKNQFWKRKHQKESCARDEDFSTCVLDKSSNISSSNISRCVQWISQPRGPHFN